MSRRDFARPDKARQTETCKSCQKLSYGKIIGTCGP